jgi:hypothetical protein
METIRIGDKYYNAENLTEQAITLLNDIRKVDGELGRLSLQTSIVSLAKGTLVDKLLVETENLEEVDAPVEAQSDSTDTDLSAELV